MRQKEALDNRVEMAIAYNEKVNHIKDEMHALTEQNNTFKDGITRDMTFVREVVTKNGRELWEHQHN